MLILFFEIIHHAESILYTKFLKTHIFILSFYCLILTKIVDKY